MNHKNTVSFILFTFLIATASFAGETAAPLSTPEIKQMVGANKKNTILFFQNPLGGPCQQQKVILDKLFQDMKGSFNIANISTMKAEDQAGFYAYGVRSLPLLVLVDRNGNINKVFSPGIQSAATLSAALGSIK